MTISYEELTKDKYTRHRGKTWICHKCGKVNPNRSINPRSGEIQRCSKCGTPKPMIFGVRVCESCKTSDQVYVVPAFVHTCPDCGSEELNRFRPRPITDKALKEGIHPNYASLKWTCKCGNENPYPYATCLRCGLSIDKGLNETSADAGKPNEKAEDIAKKMRLSNWECSYCGQINRGTDQKCRRCGNSERSSEDDIIRKFRPDLFLDENSSKPSTDSNDQYAKQGSIHEIPVRKNVEFHSSILEKGENLLADAMSVARKVWWAFPILFIILLIMGNYKEEEYIISDMKYESTYIIEKYTTTHHTGETTHPINAYNIVESKESRYVQDDDDDDDNGWGTNDNWGTNWDDDDDDNGWGTNNDWGTNWDTNDDDNGWGTNDDWGTDWGWDTGDNWGSDDWNDYGGDYFDSMIHVIRRLRNSIKTNTKKLLTRIEYYTVYEYDIDEWVYSGTINYSGGKEEIIKSPESELTENEKISSSSTRYIVYLGSQSLKLKITEEEWHKYNVGDTVRVKTLFGYPQFIVKEY